MQIRLAAAPDLSGLAQLWFDRIKLLQQTDPQIKLLPDAKNVWRANAMRWIADDQVRFLVAEENAQLLGFTVVCVASGEPGAHPARKGLLLDMAVDLHQTRHGLSERLLGRAKAWLAEMNVTHLEVEVATRYPVEAAFWRAQGGVARFERLSLRI